MKERKVRTDGLRTREAILAAASEEFAAKGFELASVREICKRAGANVALANRYFGSKEELYRHVARHLFGDLGAPMTNLAAGVKSAADWRGAVETWVVDFLLMTIPSAKPQRLCAGLFRQEVSSPTKFHAEFKRDFGKPVYDALRDHLAMALDDEAEIVLWASSIWAQVSVYALADRKWQASFQPKGAKPTDWRAKVGEHIAGAVFASLKFRKGGR